MAASPLYDSSSQSEEPEDQIEAVSKALEQNELADDKVIDIRNRLEAQRQGPAIAPVNSQQRGLNQQSLQNFSSAQKQLASSGSAGSKTAANDNRVSDAAKDKAKELGKKELSNIVKTEGKLLAKEVAAPIIAAVAPYVGIGLMILLGISLLIFAIYGVWSILGNTGGGPAIHPATASQRQQVSALGALTGSQLANNQLVARTIANEKARLASAKTTIQTVYAKDGAKATAASADLDTIVKAMDAVASEPLADKRKTMIDAITKQLQDFGNKYPEILGYGATNGSYLNVPGVSEDKSHACGQASTIMVILYYNPAYNDTTFYNAASHSTNGTNVACVSPDYISNHNDRAKDWDWADPSLDKVKNSLAGGDPVIVYTKPGGVYPNSKHIFVLVGYDPSDDTFIVNNPYPGGVNVHVKNPNNVTMTSSHLSSFLGGEAIYSHGSFLIRKKYL